MAFAEALGAPAGAIRPAAGRLAALVTALVDPTRKSLLEPEVGVSAWDPDTPYERIEISRCRALLLEIIRRAIHDWVLYRNHSNLALKSLAMSAYTWLFEEAPGTAAWRERQLHGEPFTAFFNLCEILDLDPEFVRRRAKQTTVKQIMASGRPSERRSIPKEVDYEEHALDEASLGVVDALDAPRVNLIEELEAQFAVYTPDYL